MRHTCMEKYGLGAGAAETASASHINAAALVQSSGFSPCTSNATISTFQTDYNTDNGVTLTVDGIFGPNTNSALLAANGLSVWPSAVQVCSTQGSGGVAIPSTDPSAVVGDNTAYYVAGGLALAALGIGWAWYTKRIR